MRTPYAYRRRARRTYYVPCGAPQARSYGCCGASSPSLCSGACSWLNPKPNPTPNSMLSPSSSPNPYPTPSLTLTLAASPSTHPHQVPPPFTRAHAHGDGAGRQRGMVERPPLAVPQRPSSPTVLPQGAPGSTERPATALGARASRLQRRRCPRCSTIQAAQRATRSLGPPAA